MSPTVRRSLFNTAVRRLGDDLDMTGAPLADLNIDPNAAQLNTSLSRSIQVINAWRSAEFLFSHF